jgi:hypothetical protein
VRFVLCDRRLRSRAQREGAEQREEPEDGPTRAHAPPAAAPLPLPLALFLRHLSEQYLTPSGQTLAHLDRYSNGKPHAAQIFVGSSPFLSARPPLRPPAAATRGGCRAAPLKATNACALPRAAHAATSRAPARELKWLPEATQREANIVVLFRVCVGGEEEGGDRLGWWLRSRRYGGECRRAVSTKGVQERRSVVAFLLCLGV